MREGNEPPSLNLDPPMLAMIHFHDSMMVT
jgi:hypothetical protein